MPDFASLSFDIDSSQAQRAIGVLETLKASSISLTQGVNAQAQATQNLAQVYDQQRDQLTRLVTATRSYDGTVQGLVGRLDSLRRGMAESQQSMTAYASTLTQAASAATSFNASVEGLDRYVAKANELRTTTANLGTELERITAALKNQTVEGNQTRQMLTQLGISTAGVSANRPDIILQRLADAARQYRMTSGTVSAFQNVLGPGFDAQSLTALGSQPYVTNQQNIEANRTTAARAQIDSQQQQILRITADLARNEARRQDLASQYTVNPTVLGRLGLSLGGALMSRDQQRTRLEQIDQMAPDQRQQYEGYGYQIRRFLDQGTVAGGIRNFTSGTYGSNSDEINARYNMEGAQSGYLGAFFRAQGRDIQNTLGGFVGMGYRPLLTQDNRQISPAEQRYLREQSGGILAGFGDTSLQNANQADQRLRDFNAPDTGIRQRYTASFGDVEGNRRFANQQSTLALQARYANAPEQQTIDQARQEALLMALPQEQRNEARYRLDFLSRNAGPGAVANLPVDTTLAGIAGSPRLSAAQQAAATQGFQQNVSGQLQQSREENANQIAFQKQLAEQLGNGRAAAEDFTRAWQAYRQALVLSNDESKATAAGLDAIGVALAQRTTQATAVTAQMRQENNQAAQRLEQAKQYAALDPVTRAVFAGQLGIEQEIQTATAGGNLPNPAGGTFHGQRISAPDAQATIQARRTEMQRQQITASQTAGQETITALQDEIRDNQTLLHLMEQQNLTMDQASAHLATQKKFYDELKAARMSGDQAAIDAAQQQIDLANQLQRIDEATQQRARNAETVRQSGTAASGSAAVSVLPPSQQGNAAALLGFLHDNVQHGVISPSGGAPLWINRPEAAPYLPMLQQQAQQRGMPVEVLAELIGQESGFRNVPNQMGPSRQPVSSAGGLGQQINQNVYLHGGDKYDPATSIAAAAEEFSKRLAAAHGDIDVAATGYGVAGTNLPLARRQAVLDSLHRAQAAGDVTTNQTTITSDAELLRRAQAGELPPDLQRQADALMADRQQTQGAQVMTGSQLLIAQQGAQARRTALLGQGETGAAARISVPSQITDPTLANFEAQRQAIDTETQQQQAQANAHAATINQTESLRKEADALTSSYGNQEAAMKAVGIQIQVANEAQQRGPGVVDVAARTKELQDQQLAEAQKAAADQNIENEKNMAVQAAVNARGPFASNLDLANTRRNVQTQQKFDATPGLEQSPEGQKMLQDNKAASELEAQTQQMNELRSAAQGVQSAMENAMTSLIINGEKGRMVARSLAASLEEVVLKAAVFQPFEKATDTALTSLFAGSSGGGGTGGGGGGGGGGSGVGGAVGAVTQAAGGGSFLDRLFGLGGGTGGGGGGAPSGGGAAASGGGAASGAYTGGAGDSGSDGTGDAYTYASAGGANDNAVSGGGVDSGTGDTGTDDSSAASGGGSNRMGGAGSGVGAAQKLLSSPGVGQQLDAMMGATGSRSGSGGVFSHAGGLTGYLVDQIGGQGFYKGGGLIGSLFGGPSQQQVQAGQQALIDPSAGYGGSGGSGGAADTGSITPPIPPLEGGGAVPQGTEMAPQDQSALQDQMGNISGSSSSNLFDANSAGSAADATGFGALDTGMTSPITSDVVGASTDAAADASLSDVIDFAALGKIFPANQNSGQSNIADFENQIIHSPTFFRFASGAALGLMGEAGSEAVMPLKRGTDGRLGVSVSGPAAGAAPNVTFNIQTPNADSFRATQSQIHSRAMSQLSLSQARNG